MGADSLQGFGCQPMQKALQFLQYSSFDPIEKEMEQLLETV